MNDVAVWVEGKESLPAAQGEMSRELGGEGGLLCWNMLHGTP